MQTIRGDKQVRSCLILTAGCAAGCARPAASPPSQPTGAVDLSAVRSDGLVHHVETWVTHRDIWRRTTGGWKLYRVDSLRDRRRLIDGQPG